MEISPKYLMKLIDQIEKALWDEFPHAKYKNVKRYIEKWHEGNFDGQNFYIRYQDDGEIIDLGETLHGIDPETLVKIAIDLGVETPDFIPSIPVFKNKLKDGYRRALDSFNEAIKNVLEQPSVSVGMANSTLESIIKYILEDKTITVKWKEKDTLYAQTQNLLKEFKMFPGSHVPVEINDIGNGLLKASKSIEDLRSRKTLLHGKTDNDYMVEDSLYACFVVNAVATIGLFLMSFYEKKYKNKNVDSEENIPTINLDDDSLVDIPF